jgi:DNA-binding GntR family transcriptional regulator
VSQEHTTLGELWQARPSGLPASEAAYDTLRRAIIQRHLLAGSRLNEVALAQTFSISRTPIREALLRLESEKLVERKGRGGLVVGEVTPQEILELHVVGQALHGLASRLAAANASAIDLAELRWIHAELQAANAAHDYQRMAAVSLRFHERIGQATGNAVLLSLISDIHDRVRRFPGTTLAYPGRATEAVTDNEALLGAIESRDGDLAERLACDQLARSMDVRLEMLHRRDGQTGVEPPLAEAQGRGHFGTRGRAR